jgi:hypothetical protein
MPGAQEADRWVQALGARAQSGIMRSGSCDRDRTVEINARGVCGCGRRRSCSSAVKSLDLGRVWAKGVLRSSGLARIDEENLANTLVGFWPRDRGQRWENGGGRAPGGSGLIPARIPSRGERQSSAIGPGLAPVGVGAMGQH